VSPGSIQTSALPGPATRRVAGLTHARARLLLGTTGVGLQLLLAVWALARDLPGRWLPGDVAQPLAQAVVATLPALLIPALVQFPLDLLGGLVAVRVSPGVGRWLLGWTRGALVQLATWSAALALLMCGARLAGAVGALAAGSVGQLVLLALRGPLARAASALRPASGADASRLRTAAAAVGLDPVRLRVVAVDDETFVGGWTGLAPRTLWVPARWAELPEPVLRAQLARRRAVQRGAHLRGVALALLWNVAGLALVLWGAGVDARSAGGVVTLSLLLVPWTFLGLLLLPTPSRAAVRAADVVAARAVGQTATREALTRLDRWQDDEPTRARGVETIFHPVPALARRLAALDAVADASAGDVPASGGAHHAARHALYLAWALASPLSRAVHCNVGRPAVWVLLPGD
jgi:hypothetical protein